MRPANLKLHIEELVLEGFARSDRHLIADAFRRELTHLFAAQGVPPSLTQSGEISRLDGGTFELALGASPRAIGIQVAQAVYAGLGR